MGITNLFNVLMKLAVTAIVLYAAGKMSSTLVPVVFDWISHGSYSTAAKSAIGLGSIVAFFAGWLILLKKLAEAWGFDFFDN